MDHDALCAAYIAEPHAADRHDSVLIAFLCADLGLSPQPREEHASYLAHWLAVLKADTRAIFTAAAHAQRAADFLHALQPDAQQVAA